MKNPIFIELIKRNFPLLSLIVFLICLKITTFNLPIYWDESIYFTPYIFKFGYNAFLPLKYIPEVFHGHPYLLQILLLFSSYIFGTNQLAAHMVSLGAFIYFLFISREFIKTHLNERIANLSLIMFSLFPFVFIQSFLFFPNYLMIALGFHSYLYFLKREYSAYALMIFLCVMTRESALAFALLPMLIKLYDFIKKKDNFLNFVKTLVPFVTIILFFIYNKAHSYADSYINHPYVHHRYNQNQIKLEILISEMGNSLYKLVSATFIQLPNFLLVILGICLTLAIIKRKIKFQLKTVHYLLLTSASIFTIFFLMYGDSIPRDFTFPAFLFAIFCTYLLSIFIRTEFIVLIILIAFTRNTKLHLYSGGVDMTAIGFIQRILIMQDLGNIVNKYYSDKEWIKCTWPSSRLLEDPEYGYVKNSHRTTIFDWEADILLRSKLNIPEHYPTDNSVWEAEQAYKRHFEFSKSTFYHKIKQVPKPEDQQ